MFEEKIYACFFLVYVYRFFCDVNEREGRVFLYSSDTMAMVEKEYSNPRKKNTSICNDIKTNTMTCTNTKITKFRTTITMKWR